jgi:hypothetical protein
VRLAKGSAGKASAAFVSTGVAAQKAALVLCAVVIALLAAGCETLAPMPVVAGRHATLAGVVRGPDGVADRLVEAVDVDTGWRKGVWTNSAGAFRMLVPPGCYRIEVALGPSEAVAKGPGVIEVGPGDLRRNVDVVLGGAGVVDLK